MDKELAYRYQKLSLTVLQKALDEICPKFEDEEKVKERIELFEVYELELDEEWEELEREAERELELFYEERNLIFSKIERTKNSNKVQSKVDGFETKKQRRVEYLHRKRDQLLGSIPLDDEKLEQKRERINNQYDEKIRKSEIRFNTIINNTLNTDNTENVARRLEQSKKVWDRKYEELKHSFELREIIHNNKRMEFDQIRLAVQGFEEEFERVALWCLMGGVTPLSCYVQVKERMEMIGLETLKIDTMISDIRAGFLTIDK